MRRGYVVLAPDYVYMADEQPDPYELDYKSGTMKGIHNHVRGIDLLVSLPQVDPGTVSAPSDIRSAGTTRCSSPYSILVTRPWLQAADSMRLRNIKTAI